MKYLEAGKWVRILTWLFASGWLLFFGFSNEVPADTGDGLAHFFISQISWQDPSYFFDHWGKPVFILLSSPFAQFGFSGMIIFNVLVFSASMLIGYKLLDKLNVSAWLQSLLPLFLLTAKDYCLTVMGGLTEPLFNLALIVAALFLFQKRYLWLALLVSFMPFMRSEGQLPVLLVGVILAYNKEWKYFPILLVGFVVYSIAGAFAHHDLLWYFTKSPYSMGNAIYGKGEWSHYFTSYRNYIGNPGIFMSILGVIGAIGLLVKKRMDGLEIDLSLLAYGTFVGVVFSHAYFWATGQNGSIGLTRIATQGMPLFLIVQMTHWSRFSHREGSRVCWVYGVLSIPFIWSLVINPKFPVLAKPMEKQLQSTWKFINEKGIGNEKVYYHFPYLAHLMDENPLSKKSRAIFTGFHKIQEDLKMKIPQGSFIVWDSHFGPVEAGRSAEEMRNNPGLILVGEFLYEGTEEDPKGVLLFQHVPEADGLSNYQVSTKRMDDVHQMFESKTEFINLFEGLLATQRGSELTYSIRSEEGTSLVFESDEGGYISFELSEIGKELRFSIPKSGSSKLYVWNPNGNKGKIEITNVELRSKKYPEVWKP